MLSSTVRVMRGQRVVVKGDAQAEQALRHGLRFWQERYGEPCVNVLRRHWRERNWKGTVVDATALLLLPSVGIRSACPAQAGPGGARAGVRASGHHRVTAPVEERSRGARLRVLPNAGRAGRSFVRDKHRPSNPVERALLQLDVTLVRERLRTTP